MKTFHAEIYSTVPNPDCNPDSDMKTSLTTFTVATSSILDVLEALKNSLTTSGLVHTHLAIDIEEI